MGVKRGLDGLRQVLDGMTFPVGRDDVVERAVDEGGDEEMVSALRAMPPADFHEAEQVLRAVPLREVTDAHTEAAQKQRQERVTSSTSDQVPDPVNPIEDELGENRRA